MTIKLVRFMMKLSGKEIKLELKDGSIMCGTIASVDASMNTHLTNVKVTAKGKPSIQLEQSSVRGNNIRYYELPDDLNLDALLQELSDPRIKRKAPAERGRGGARGGSRGTGGRGGRGAFRGGRGDQ
eukprot:PhF_6_TR4673/c0_g1_i1/m.6509/K11087/SNRPD1, SMD1; small nuclear ribonucleoprotein D1